MKMLQKFFTIAVVLIFFVAFADVMGTVMCKLVPEAYPERTCAK